MLRSIFFASTLLAATTLANAQTQNQAPAQAQQDPWTQHSGWVSSAIESCKAAADDRASCRQFPGEALRELFGVSEFCGEASCMRASEIEYEMRNNPDHWSVIGQASDQAALDRAHELAVSGHAVVAVQNVDDAGQVAIIMPGKPVPSGKWSMDRVPVAAAARVDVPEKSIFGQGINWVFSNPEQVTLYTRL